MLRSMVRLAQTVAKAAQPVVTKRLNPVTFTTPAVRKFSSEVGPVLTPEEQDAQWIHFFEDPELDSYSLIIGYLSLDGEDLVPEPKVIQSVLYACRRVDNFPIAMRILEMIRLKCDDREDIYNYLMQELQPTLDDLGLTTVEEMGLHEVED